MNKRVLEATEEAKQRKIFIQLRSLGLLRGEEVEKKMSFVNVETGDIIYVDYDFGDEDLEKLKTSAMLSFESAPNKSLTAKTSTAKVKKLNVSGKTFQQEWQKQTDAKELTVKEVAALIRPKREIYHEEGNLVLEVNEVLGTVTVSPPKEAAHSKNVQVATVRSKTKSFNMVLFSDTVEFAPGNMLLMDCPVKTDQYKKSCAKLTARGDWKVLEIMCCPDKMYSRIFMDLSGIQTEAKTFSTFDNVIDEEIRENENKSNSRFNSEFIQCNVKTVELKMMKIEEERCLLLEVKAIDEQNDLRRMQIKPDVLNEFLEEKSCEMKVISKMKSELFASGKALKKMLKGKEMCLKLQSYTIEDTKYYEVLSIKSVE